MAVAGYVGSKKLCPLLRCSSSSEVVFLLAAALSPKELCDIHNGPCFSGYSTMCNCTCEQNNANMSNVQKKKKPL